MTATAANTPRFGSRGSKLHANNCTKDNSLETRIIGVEVVCGRIDTHFIYYTDNLIGHGGNVMIEVFRQSKTALIITVPATILIVLCFDNNLALIDLALILRENHMVLPRELFLHYDNCNENKVCCFKFAIKLCCCIVFSLL